MENQNQEIKQDIKTITDEELKALKKEQRKKYYGRYKEQASEYNKLYYLKNKALFFERANTRREKVKEALKLLKEQGITLADIQL